MVEALRKDDDYEHTGSTGSGNNDGPKQNVANIAEVVVESNDDGAHPAEAWDTANVFDGKWIVNVVHILCIGRDC